RVNNLQGNFPPSIFLQPKLEHLVISYNTELAVSLPPQNLRRSSCLVAPLVPSNPPTRPRLEVKSNTMNGSILSSCISSRISSMNVSSGNPPGLIPDGLCSFSHITHLWLSGNSLNGTIPTCFSCLSSLDWLDLSYNCLTGSIPLSLFTLPFLQMFVLNDNSFSGSLPKFYNPSSKLTNLYLDNNLLNGDIDNNLLNGDISFISEQGKLQFLDLSSNNIEGKISSCFLRFLILDQNKLDGFQEPTNTTRAIGARLTLLRVSSNRINGLIPTFLCNYIAESATLDMSSNALTGATPICLCKVNRSNLSINQLQGQIPNGFNNIQLLDMNSNILTDTIQIRRCISRLARPTKLKVLVLRSNHLYGPIFVFANSLQAFVALKIFDISNNHFSGTLQHDLFDGLKAMIHNGLENDYVDKAVFSTEFILGGSNASSYFSFNGEIEQTMKGNDRPLTSIKGPMNVLEMSNNNFTGEIHKDIGRLKYLCGLNVSNNHLKGPIINSFGNML
ncbi:Receptor-like protein 12, partial [Nymphaea thermarum]